MNTIIVGSPLRRKQDDEYYVGSHSIIHRGFEYVYMSSQCGTRSWQCRLCSVILMTLECDNALWMIPTHTHGPEHEPDEPRRVRRPPEIIPYFVPAPTTTYLFLNEEQTAMLKQQKLKAEATEKSQEETSGVEEMLPEEDVAETTVIKAEGTAEDPDVHSDILSSDILLEEVVMGDHDYLEHVADEEVEQLQAEEETPVEQDGNSIKKEEVVEEEDEEVITKIPILSFGGFNYLQQNNLGIPEELSTWTCIEGGMGCPSKIFTRNGTIVSTISDHIHSVPTEPSIWYICTSKRKPETFRIRSYARDTTVQKRHKTVKEILETNSGALRKLEKVPGLNIYKSHSGAPKIEYQGYEYTISGKSGSMYHWICSKSNLKCYARLRILEKQAVPEGKHTHEPATPEEIQERMEASVRREKLLQNLHLPKATLLNDLVKDIEDPEKRERVRNTLRRSFDRNTRAMRVSKLQEENRRDVAERRERLKQNLHLPKSTLLGELVQDIKDPKRRERVRDSLRRCYNKLIKNNQDVEIGALEPETLAEAGNDTASS